MYFLLMFQTRKNSSFFAPHCIFMNTCVTVISHFYSVVILSATTFFTPLSLSQTSGRWDGVAVICFTLHPADGVALICNVLRPSVPAMEHVWFVTRSVSPALCVWFVALCAPSAPQQRLRRVRHKHVLWVLQCLSHSFFFLPKIYSICMLCFSGWHLDDKLTLLGVTVPSMN